MARDQASLIRYLGGDSGHLSFFGGTGSRSRTVFIGVFIVGGMVGMVFHGGIPVLVLATTGVGGTLLVTARTSRGTFLERHAKRARWKARKRLGTDQYMPFDQQVWDRLQQQLAVGTGAQKRGAATQIARMRANPDGADGMGWLQYRSRRPGIAWHAPVGEQPYLSVAFSVSGQLRGLESTGALVRASTGWGRFLARHGATSSLVSDVQTLTRVLPPDTARQQLWVKEHLEPVGPDWSLEDVQAFEEQKRSYDEVIRLSSAAEMVQSHYVIVSWPLTQSFTDAARRHRPGRDGWRDLMRSEIAGIERGLRQARMGAVRAMTAKQTTQLMLHQQNPHLPADLIRDTNPLQAGIASHDEFSAHIVHGKDITALAKGQEGWEAPDATWWHRTAAIRAEYLSANGRTPLWLLDLLTGRELKMIRSVSFHLHLIPAEIAKARDQQDIVRGQATILSAKEKGRLVVDDDIATVSQAQRRRNDMVSGSHHHGVEWVGYITISAPTRDALGGASRDLEEVCAGSLGITRLDWQDSFQAAASGTTWPIGRGLRPSSVSLADKTITRLAGRSDKEALS